MSATEWLAAVSPPEPRETLVTVAFGLGPESSFDPLVGKVVQASGVKSKRRLRCSGRSASVGAQAVAARRTVGTQTGSGTSFWRWALVGLSVCALVAVAAVASASCHAAGVAGCAIGTAAASPQKAADVQALQRRLMLLEAENAGLVHALEQSAALLATPGAVPKCVLVAGHWAQSWGSDVTQVTQEGCLIRARNPKQWWRSAKGIVSGHVVKMFGLEGVVSRNLGAGSSTIGWTNGAMWIAIDNQEEQSRKESLLDGEQYSEMFGVDIYAGESANHFNGTVCSSTGGCSQ